MDILPIILTYGVIGFLLGMLPLALLLWKVPEARFYTLVRIFKNIVVRIHHADDRERWYRGTIGPSGLVVNDSKGNMLAINPDKLQRGKSSFSMGMDYVDVGTNSLWPVGAREGLYVNMVDDYIDNPENHCDFLRSREQMERHTLLHATKVDLPNKIQPMLNIDPAMVKVVAEGKTEDQVNKELVVEYNRLVYEAIKNVMNEIEKVKTAMEGRVVLDQPFSWSNACFAINSQLQPENIKKLDAVLQRLAFDEEKNEDKKWNRVYLLLVCGGFALGAPVLLYKLLFG